jgi:tetratricopeptide (TPR) repeat protein
VAADLTAAPPEAPDAAELAAEAYRVVVEDPARARALAAAALRHADGHPAAASAAHRALGMAALELDGAATAIGHFQRAVDAGRRVGRQREAEARMSLAFALVAHGSTRRALRQADLATRVTGVAERGPLHLQHAIILERLGRYDEALDGYRRALASFRRSGDRNGEARVLCDRGVLQTYRGALTAADADLQRSELLCEELGLTLMAAGVVQNLGFVAAQRGDVPRALELYERAQLTWEPLGGTRYALLELDRCQLLLATGLVREARESADRALRALERAGMDAEVAEALLQRAEVALAEHDWATAQATASRALGEFTAQRRPTWAALARYASVRAAWGNAGGGPPPPASPDGDGSIGAAAPRGLAGGGAELLAAARRAARELERSGWTARAVQARLLAGRVALDLGRPRAARGDLERARRARLRGPAVVRIAAWHAEALHCLADGRPQAARRAVAGGLRALDEHRAALGATELRSHAAAQADELAALGLRFALASGRPGAALAAAERARGRAAQLPPVRPPRDPALAAKLGELRAVVALAGEEVRAGRPSARLVTRQTELEHQIRRRLLHVRGSGRLEPASAPTLGALRAALGERTLIEYLSLDGSLHAVTATARRVRLHPLGPAAAVGQELALLRFALRRLAAAPATGAAHRHDALLETHRENARAAAARLQALLLEPLLAEVGDGELVIVPTGELHGLPWAALGACAGRAVSVAPSAALWLRAGERPAPPRPRTLLVAGPGLAHAEDEVRALARLYGDALTLTGADARVDAVAAALARCDRAHLACHGSFRDDNPLFSALLLADGPLTVHDLESLGAGPRELVLSACDSGRSVVRPGDELMGLTSALLSIGAGVIVASTVAVPDAPAQALMVGLHERLIAGSPPAAALAAAQAAAPGDGDAAGVARDAFACFGAG